MTLVFQKFFPLNYVVSRLFFLALLAATTIVLAQLVRTLARSEDWWTVALLLPFALSLTLVSPVWWWSNGLPVFPNLFFTAVAILAWIQSYAGRNHRFWIAIAVAAITVAGGFYMKFLLIPVYLLFMRILIFPRLFALPSGIRSLWRERARWIAVATPPALFLAAFLLSGLAARTAVSGERPYVAYFFTAWFNAVVPVAFLNSQVEGSAPALARLTIIGSQCLFFVAFVATCWRSSLAIRGWALFALAFFANTAMVGTFRLATHGLEIAYWLRYYPEILFFLPLTLALGLRQGAERGPGVSWEHTATGRTAIGVFAILQFVGIVVWAPIAVGRSDGVRARVWYDNLREDIRDAAAVEPPVRIVDSEAPEYILASWLEPRNRISAVLSVIDLNVTFNDLAPSTYLVLEDGHLAKAEFRPIVPFVSGIERAAGAHIAEENRSASDATCLDSGGALQFVPPEEILAERLSIRILYGAAGGGPVPVQVDTADQERPLRHLQLQPARNRAELIDLGTSSIRALKLGPVPEGGVCIRVLEIGSLFSR